MDRKKKILVVGQTPPPYGGQAMMTERLLKSKMEGIEWYHVRMNFSKSIGEIGKFSANKIFHLLEIIFKSLFVRFRYGVKELYYMPVGNNPVPLIRDMLILLVIKWFFPRKIYHYRSAGVSSFVQQLSPFLSRLVRWIYGKPAVAIHLAARNPNEGAYFGAKKTFVVPNGLEDSAKDYLPISKPDGPVRILSVGVVRASKGIMVLLEAANYLMQKGLDFQVDIVGGFESEVFEQEAKSYIQQHNLSEKVNFLGVLTGAKKWDLFVRSHIFCFPSYFESESFGNVVLEAMMFEMPVVGSDWRGIPEIIVHGKTGMVVPVKDAVATAESLEALILNPENRISMGKMGRERFLQHYQLPFFIKRMEKVILGEELGASEDSLVVHELTPYTS